MIALAMIVKGVDSEAEVLARCLGTAATEVDAIYLTFTHKPGQAVSQRCYDVANMFGAVTSKFEWCNDFAKARNFSFAQVPKDYGYILWLDADDALRLKDASLKETIEQHPADAYSMFYLYAFDEHKNPTVVHHKTRVVRNDGSVEWAGRLHEDFKENRAIERFHIEGIDVLHLSNDARFAEGRERNYEVALAQLQESPEDPRSHWNAGNSAFGIGKYDDALEFLRSFLARSTSEEEKYLARQRMAEVHWQAGRLNEALDEAAYAIGLRPEYPDAYHLKGKILYQMNRFEEAKDMFLNGLGRPVPYYSIIVYNPREYDYVPLMNLAKTYYALNLPQLALPAFEAAAKIVPLDAGLKKVIRQLRKEAKEGDEVIQMVAKMRKALDKPDKLQKLLAKVPDKFRFHPEVLRIRNTAFPKTESSGRDVSVFCGFTEEEWTPKSIAKKGSGGSEEAIITLTEGLAARGWNVTVYNNCGTEESIHNGVTYKPYLAWNYRDKQDVTIIWRNPGMCKYDINSTKVFVDMHDVIPAGEFTQDRIDRITKVFFKSTWHRELFPNVPDEKCVILPNGIDVAAFSQDVERDPKLVVNTASPVRSLSALIEVMKLVRKEVPDAKMQWAYGWTTTDYGLKTDEKYGPWKESVLKGMEEAGIEPLGRLTFKEIATLYQQANVYAYPTGFPEIDCISITKAMAAGAYPVTTDYGAIKEKAGFGSFISYPDNHESPGQIDYAAGPEVYQEFANQIVNLLNNPPPEDQRTAMREWAKSKFDWQHIIQTWDSHLNA